MSARRRVSWILNGHQNTEQALQVLQQRVDVLVERLAQVDTHIDRRADELRSALGDAIDDLAGRAAALSARLDAM